VCVCVCACVIVQLIKSDIDAYRSAVDYVTECHQLSESSVTPGSAMSVSVDALANMKHRYEALTSDVDSRLSELSAATPQWRHFDQSVCDVNDWLNMQRDKVPQLLQATQEPALAQAAARCQVTHFTCLYGFISAAAAATTTSSNTAGLFPRDSPG